MHLRASLAVLLLPLAVACGPGPGGGPADGPIHSIWEEDSDPDNNSAADGEPVSVDWTGSVTIEGSMSDCGYDPDENWPWTGDEDNYLVEVPADGYLDAVLTWDTGADLDMLIYFEPPSGFTISPDEQLASADDDGEISYLFDEAHDEGDEVVFGVLCASGPNGDYSLRIGWED
ncbi:MAG: hypothetical protein GY898_21950 [Proteobacteria bacterium]|nr:hypothetical protein [Pseudomonadota bacterium]